MLPTNKYFTVTIGIPAHNEEDTICILLNQIKSQTQKDYLLERILVIDDGSTDKTSTIVESYKSDKVELISHKSRHGKASRLNEIFSLNRSDLICILDADLIIEDELFINKLVNNFKHSQIGIVSANNLPHKPSSFVGRIWYSHEILWYEIRRRYQNGNNVFNNSGCSIMVRSEVAKQISLPKELIADQTFVYFQSQRTGLHFKFVEDAIVYYLPPSNLHDIVSQYKRSLGEDDLFVKYFGHNFDKDFHIPFSIKVKGLIFSIFKDPLFTLLSIIFIFVLSVTVIDRNEQSEFGIWEKTRSTKITKTYVN